jgi:hypothetical protein
MKMAQVSTLTLFTDNLLFFRWIRMRLRIKAFYGTRENAVKTQFRIAVSVSVLIAVIRERLGIEASLCQLLQIFSVILFEKIQVFLHA